MIQSSLLNSDNQIKGRGLHVAIIMDGNGRWAIARGRPRVFGHRAGADAVRRVVEAAPNYGIDVLTLYAFSTDNWKRPQREVVALMRLLRVYLRKETARCLENGVRISVIGRRDRLAPEIRREIELAEASTRHGQRLQMRIAIDYSSRDAILLAATRAAQQLQPGETLTREQFVELLANPQESGAPDVDLLIRTGGEQRLSDYLLWESAYAELYFTRRMWPDFDANDLAAAVAEFHSRERRFGTVPTAVAG